MVFRDWADRPQGIEAGVNPDGGGGYRALLLGIGRFYNQENEKNEDIIASLHEALCSAANN